MRIQCRTRESWLKGGNSEGRGVWEECVGLESDERESKSGLYY